MELRQIEYVTAVNKYKNYTKAANALHVSQPTISIAIQKLEEELGFRLLERDNKKLIVTPEGEVFLKYAERVMGDMERLEEVMDDLKPSARKLLKVSFPSNVGSWIWRELLYRFPEVYPDIELEIRDLGTLDTIRLLKEREQEIGYGVIGMIKDDEIDHEVIRSGELKVIFSKNHPFADRDRIPIELLKDEHILMYRKGTTYTESLLVHNLKQAGITPDFLYLREQSSVFNLVAQECGIAVVPDDSVSVIKDNSQICSAGFRERIEYETGLIWNKNHFLSSSARKFKNFIGEYRI